MKKILIIFFLLISIFYLNSIVINAEENFLHEEDRFQTLNFTGYREHWKSWWNKWNYDYYKDDYKVLNNGLKRRVYLNKASETLFFSKNEEKVEFTFTVQFSSEIKNSIEDSTYLGISSSFSKVLGLSLTLESKNLHSETIKISSTNSYKYTLDRKSKKGYYSLYWAANVVDLEYKTYWRDLPKDNWELYKTGKIYAFTSKTPYLILRYSKNEI